LTFKFMDQLSNEIYNYKSPTYNSFAIDELNQTLDFALIKGRKTKLHKCSHFFITLDFVYKCIVPRKLT